MSAGAARLCGRCGRVRPISQRAAREWVRHLLKLLATTDRGMHGLRRRTSLQRSRGGAADM